ncbi:MAG: tetratricopeptide repeat protein [Thermoplasmatota archaeon]
MRPVLLAVLVVALAAPAGHASPVLGDLSAQSARLQGEGSFHAPLGAIVEMATTSDAPFAPPNFELRAASLSVQTVVRDPTAAIVPGSIGVQPTTNTTTFSAATVTGTTNGALYRWNVFPLQSGSASVNSQAACLGVASSTVNQFQWQPRIGTSDSGRSITADLTGGLELVPCPDGPGVEVSGDFVVTMWQWNATLVAGADTRVITTGDSPEAGMAAASPARHWQEVYIYVTNGTLSVPNPGGSASHIWTHGGGHMGATGQVVLSRVRGDFLGHAVQAGEFTISGNLEATLGALSTNEITASLTGDATGAYADHQDLLASSSAAMALGAPGALFSAALFVAVALILVASRRRISFWEAGRALAAAGRQRTLRGRLYGRLALILDPANAHAHTALGAVYQEVGHFEAALAHHIAAYDLFVPEAHHMRARSAMEASRACEAMNQRPQAVDWLTRAHQHEPQVALEVLQTPGLGRLRAAWRAPMEPVDDGYT